MGFRRYIKCLPDGYSLGGLTSAITSPENMDYIKAEILFYPAFVIQDAAAELYAMGDDMPETFEITGVTLGRDLVEATVNYDLYAQAEKFTKDVITTTQGTMILKNRSSFKTHATKTSMKRKVLN